MFALATATNEQVILGSAYHPQSPTKLIAFCTPFPYFVIRPIYDDIKADPLRLRTRSSNGHPLALADPRMDFRPSPARIVGGRPPQSDCRRGKRRNAERKAGPKMAEMPISGLKWERKERSRDARPVFTLEQIQIPPSSAPFFYY